MTVHVIPLPWPAPPVTANQRGGTWRPDAARRAQTRADARWAIRAHTPGPLKPPVEVGIHWRIPDRRRRDPDGLALTMKCALDALVDEGVLTHDDWTVVRRTSQEIHPPETTLAPPMWLEVREVDA